MRQAVGQVLALGQGVSLFVGLLLGLCLSAALSGQEEKEKRPGPGEFKFTASKNIPIPFETEGQKTLELELQDALSLGLRQNVELRALQLGPKKSLADLRVAQAFFEPEVYSRTGASRSKNPARGSDFQQFDFPPIDTEIYDARLGWRQRVLTGGFYDINLFGQTLRRSTRPDNEHSTGFELSYTQPLLRGAWSNYGLRNVHVARSTRASARLRYAQSEQDILLSMVRAYWELVFAREDYRVQFQALELAREQLRITMARIAVKDLAPRDAVADEHEVARRNEGLILAENNIRAREDDLRLLLFDDRDGQMWSEAIRPISPIETDYDVSRLDWLGPARKARKNRPELQALESDIDVAETNLEAAKLDLLPQLDLTGSYNSTGVHTRRPDAYHDATDFSYPDWSLRLEFSIPLGNHAARALRDKARMELEEARRAKFARQIQVNQEVREAVRNLKTLAESIRASKESVRLAETDLDTARHKLRVGTLTFFDVQDRNLKLQEARSRLLRNQLDFRIAQAVLLHVQGRLKPGASER